MMVFKVFLTMQY